MTPVNRNDATARTARRPPPLRLAPTILLLVAGSTGACGFNSYDIPGSCDLVVAWERPGERPEVEIEIEVPVEVTYEVPADRPPFRTTVRAVTSGPEVRLSRTQPIGYCHSGELPLQHAVVSVALMGADGPWPLRICSRTATTRGPTALARARHRQAG